MFADRCWSDIAAAICRTKVSVTASDSFVIPHGHITVFSAVIRNRRTKWMCGCRTNFSENNLNCLRCLCMLNAFVIIYAVKFCDICSKGNRQTFSVNNLNCRRCLCVNNILAILCAIKLGHSEQI